MKKVLLKSDSSGTSKSARSACSATTYLLMKAGTTPFAKLALGTRKKVVFSSVFSLWSYSQERKIDQTSSGRTLSFFWRAKRYACTCCLFLWSNPLLVQRRIARLAAPSPTSAMIPGAKAMKARRWTQVWLSTSELQMMHHES